MNAGLEDGHLGRRALRTERGACRPKRRIDQELPATHLEGTDHRTHVRETTYDERERTYSNVPYRIGLMTLPECDGDAGPGGQFRFSAPSVMTLLHR